MTCSALLAGGDEMTYFCWNVEEARPCCSNWDECVGKVVLACASTLFGEADPLYAEIRWASALANMKKGGAEEWRLLRVVCPCGGQCLPCVGAVPDLAVVFCAVPSLRAALLLMALQVACVDLPRHLG